MALQKCALNLNQNLKELNPHGSLAFPCAGYSSYYTDKEENAIPWHWHEEMEIIYIEKGRLALKIPSKSFYIEAGDILAINSNILHYGIGAKNCLLHSLVFHPQLVFGSADSAFDIKYIRPLISCENFLAVPILQCEEKEMIQSFCRAFDAMEKEPAGFEFIVRESLSHLCFFLTQKFQDVLHMPAPAQSHDNLRIRRMLSYIHENYAADISLPDIAKAADIGERECLRCFQRTIQLSPIQYLLKYRIMQSAEMLLSRPEYNISDIAALCGFESPSNYAKLFKRFYDRTPREYRK